MPRQEFEPTDGLLEDVMKKQAGSLEKAVLEGVMNSVDANAENIEIVIEENMLTISDDGDGMTADDVHTYFRQFGLKDDDIEDKSFGKFRMGRGQIFNFGCNFWFSKDNIMIVDLDNDTAKINTTLHEGEKELDGELTAKIVEEDRTETTVDTSGLSYNLLKGDKEVKGCTIEVQLYNTISPPRVVDDVRGLIEFIPWVHDVDITLNGEPVSTELEPDAETDDAWFMFDLETGFTGISGYFGATKIYNQGAFVKKESLSKTASIIVTKSDIDVNFARNDILDTDETWRSIQDDYTRKLINYLLNNEDDLNKAERVWMLKQASQNDDLLQLITDVPLVEDIENNLYSINEIQDEKITFTHTRNDQAKELMNKSSNNILFFKSDYHNPIAEIVKSSNLMNYKEAVQDGSSFEMTEIDEDDLSTRRETNLQRARWFLTQCGFAGDVKPGFSKHSNVWKEDDDTLYIHKGVLNTKKKKFIVVTLEQVLREASFSGSTMEDASENHSFRRNYLNYSQNKGEFQYQLLNNNVSLPE